MSDNWLVDYCAKREAMLKRQGRWRGNGYAAAERSARQSDLENFGYPIPSDDHQSGPLVTDEQARSAPLTVSLDVTGAAPWLALIAAIAVVLAWALL